MRHNLVSKSVVLTVIAAVLAVAVFFAYRGKNQEYDSDKSAVSSVESVEITVPEVSETEQADSIEAISADSAESFISDSEDYSSDYIEETTSDDEYEVTYDDDSDYTFRTEELLEEHYEKHGIEMGFDSAEAYEEAASDVVENPEAEHKTEAEDGDDVYYIDNTNEFVVVSTDGYIRTYFFPDDGRAYFDRQ